VPGHGDAIVIEVADVTKVHRGGEVAVEALRGISFVVREGEFLAIMGPSGSGKTTLLAILGCLDRPTTGSYRLDGEEMATLNETHRARVRGQRIGFVFQAYNLLPRSTAHKNVELPLVYAGVPKRVRHGLAIEALAEVGLSERAQHRPSQLSGGEQQRVAIARALFGSPSLLLCDEPTGNLDSVNTESVMSLFGDLARDGLTLVVITHDEGVAAHARRAVRIVDGHLSVRN
jgi:putative ABC transport system ATP-binding protein